jgi:hypothetical protein
MCYQILLSLPAVKPNRVSNAFRTFPRVAETFVLAVGNSELKYTMVSTLFFIVSLVYCLITYLITSISLFKAQFNIRISVYECMSEAKVL